ncbi:MAG: DUF2017 family protein [Acidimicrobiia bacterium]
MSRRFRRKGDSLTVTLAEEEVELLRQLPGELRSLLEIADDRPDDPVVTRLFPRAYLDPTEETAEEEWQGVVHSELVRERFEALAALTASLDRVAPSKRGRLEVVLTGDEVTAWLGVLNDARLALGTRLAITEDTDLSGVDPAGAQAPAYEIYRWLTWFQGELVEVLLG